MTLPKQIPPAARVIASATLIVLAVASFEWLQPPIPDRTYAFHIPTTFFGCVEYHIRDGEIFGNMEIHQPMRLYIEGTNITMRDFLIDWNPFCGQGLQLIGNVQLRGHVRWGQNER